MVDRVIRKSAAAVMALLLPLSIGVGCAQAAQDTISITLADDDNDGLSFGRIIPSATQDSSVRVDLDDFCDEKRGAILVGGCSAAHLVVEGTAGRRYDVDIPNGVDLTSSSGEEMHVNLSDNGGGQLDDQGEDTFAIGGSLAVEQDQQPGYYEGTFWVTVTHA